MSKVILLVEDNPSDVKLTRRAFQRCGIANQLVVASDGVEALDYHFARGAYADRDPESFPAITLLDLKLPGLDGLEVLRQLRANPNTAAAPIVILTSSREQEDIARGYALGVNAYVRKPVNFEKFLEAAKTLGLFWLLLNELPEGVGTAPV